MNNDSAPLANIKQALPFMMVKDIASSLQFYSDGLGFQKIKYTLNGDRVVWCQLQRGGAVLSLQENSTKIPEELALKCTGMSVCIQCNDTMALYHEFTAKGLRPTKPYLDTHTWIMLLKDPDGYLLSFESFSGYVPDTNS